MSNIGSPEVVVLAIILLWFFGTKKLKEFAQGLGEGAKEIKKIKKNLNGESDNEN